MGLFLSLTGVIGKTRQEVANSLAKYATTVGGGLENEALAIEDDHCCVMEEANGNTTIFNPYAYLEWDRSSAFISRDLNAPVFAFHIHDGDLWMYEFFLNGETVDQFNPLPDYWDEGVTAEEIESWRGSAATIAKYCHSVEEADIANYLVRWASEHETQKAYADDAYMREDWQLLDFMRKLRLPYPLDEHGNPRGQTYKLWTADLPLKSTPEPADMEEEPISSGRRSKKSWWKLW